MKKIITILGAIFFSTLTGMEQEEDAVRKNRIAITKAINFAQTIRARENQKNPEFSSHIFLKTIHDTDTIPNDIQLLLDAFKNGARAEIKQQLKSYCLTTNHLIHCLEQDQNLNAEVNEAIKKRSFCRGGQLHELWKNARAMNLQFLINYNNESTNNEHWAHVIDSSYKSYCPGVVTGLGVLNCVLNPATWIMNTILMSLGTCFCLLCHTNCDYFGAPLGSCVSQLKDQKRSINQLLQNAIYTIYNQKDFDLIV